MIHYTTADDHMLMKDWNVEFLFSYKKNAERKLKKNGYIN